jgi:ABC-type sugar transport system substrate-binding protein
MRSVTPARLATTALAFGLLLSACGNTNADSNAAAAPAATGSEGALGDVKKIFFASPLPAYPDWAAAGNCFESALKDNGVDGSVQGPTGLQIQDQFVLDRISQAITSGDYDGIVMVPIQPAKYAPFVKRAKDAGMHVATMQLPAPGADFTVGTDAEQYSADVAKAIGDRGGQQNVVVISDAAGGIGDVFIKPFTNTRVSKSTLGSILATMRYAPERWSEVGSRHARADATAGD